MKFKEKTVFTYKNISVFVSFQNLPNSGIAPPFFQQKGECAMHKPQSTSSRCSRHDTKHLRIVKRFVNARQFPAARRGAFGWSRKAGGRASQFKRVASVARFVFHFVNWQWIAHHLSLRISTDSRRDARITAWRAVRGNRPPR